MAVGDDAVFSASPFPSATEPTLFLPSNLAQRQRSRTKGEAAFSFSLFLQDFSSNPTIPIQTFCPVNYGSLLPFLTQGRNPSRRRFSLLYFRSLRLPLYKTRPSFDSYFFPTLRSGIAERWSFSPCHFFDILFRLSVKNIRFHLRPPFLRESSCALLL